MCDHRVNRIMSGSSNNYHHCNFIIGRVVIGVSSGMAGLVVLGIIVVILSVGLGIWKKQCRRKPGISSRHIIREVASYSAYYVQSKCMDVMVPNPCYGDRVIYEEIPCQNVHFNALPRHTHEREEGYASITPLWKITSCPLPSPPLEGCPSKVTRDPGRRGMSSLIKKLSLFQESLEEDTYTAMNPAGTLANQDRGVVSSYSFKDEDC